MPIKQGSSRKVIEENIKYLMKLGKTRSQAFAIALQEAKKNVKKNK